MKNVVLNNGVTIPEIGLGTWLISNDDIYKAFNDAIKVGYTHFDSAQDYGNEENLGRAINDCKLPRESLFITSKVASHHKSYESAKESIEISLKKLNTPYIDLMLIHCPCPWSEYHTRNKDYFKENLEVYKAMEEYVKKGQIKSIGVSNFNIEDMKNILDNCEIKPVINQIPVWIGNTDIELINFCLSNGVAIEAYSPIAHGRLLDNERVAKMAKKYNCSIAQLCIAYTLQLGCISLPKTLNPLHMKENLEINFVISNEDMEYLKSIKENSYEE